MNRRDALLTSGAMVVSASLGAIACGTRNAIAQAPHGHAPGDPGLIDASFDCLKTGEACFDLVIATLSSGDTTMAGCMTTVRDMLAVVGALSKLAIASSKSLPSAAKLAIEACGACEAECRKHAGMHAVCRTCADACARTVAAAKRVVG